MKIMWIYCAVLAATLLGAAIYGAGGGFVAACVPGIALGVLIQKKPRAQVRHHVAEKPAASEAD